ncbi:MAG: N-formylglutamate amidohydrolase [Rhodospirillaceae bacterium]|nr:N-formylglutamate amidohydrolase [Rhodospirillaceae bacterium]
MTRTFGTLTAPGVFESVFPAHDVLPLVFESPHSGTGLPGDFDTRLGAEDLAWTADSHVEQLFAAAPETGATLIAALFARAYVDVNRAPDDIDAGMLAEPWPAPLRPTTKTGNGYGLIWRYCRGAGSPIYDRPLTVAEVQARIGRYWRPYHDHLADTLASLYRRFGLVWHVSCHSMKSMGDDTAPGGARPRPDITLGDRHGRSCDGEVVSMLQGAFRERGYGVTVNDPFSGAYLVDAHGHPGQGRHSVQIEINRALYMDEETRRPHQGFERVRNDVAAIIALMADHVRTRLGLA